MTVCVAVKVSEGLVLAADSMTTVTDNQGFIVQQFEHAQKVTQLSDYPVGVMTWGMGSLQQRTIESLVTEFSESLPLRAADSSSSFGVAQFSQQLYDFIAPRYAAYVQANPQFQNQPLGMFVGGFSSGQFFAELRAFELPTYAPTDLLPSLPDGSPQFGVRWFGQTDALIRLINGADVNLLQAAMGQQFSPQVVDALFSQFSYPVLFNAMPLQDAIDFAVYLVNVVVGRFRFVVGPQLCGGDIDVAAVTRSGFEWLKRKQWTVN